MFKIIDEKSATMEKLDSLSGKKEREREQDRKDLETIAKVLKELRYLLEDTRVSSYDRSER